MKGSQDKQGVARVINTHRLRCPCCEALSLNAKVVLIWAPTVSGAAFPMLAIAMVTC